MCQRHSHSLAGVHQEDSVFYHHGHAQGERPVLLTRPLKGAQKSRDADTTFAGSPGQQLLKRSPPGLSVLMGLWGWSGDTGFNRNDLHEILLS